MPVAALLLGANLGDRLETMKQAIALIAEKAGPVIKVSSIYSTAPWGVKDQPDFLNMAILVDTSLQASELLNTLLGIEESLGRKRNEKWSARIIDIDIIYYGEEHISTGELKVPHPFLPQRRFSLTPLAEISPEWVHPLLKKNAARLLAECSDTSEVKLFTV